MIFFNGLDYEESCIFNNFWMVLAESLILYFGIKSFANGETRNSIACLIMFLFPIWVYINSVIYESEHSGKVVYNE